MAVLLTILAASARVVTLLPLVRIALTNLVIMAVPPPVLAVQLAKPVTLLLLPKTRHQAHHPVLTPVQARDTILPSPAG